MTSVDHFAGIGAERDNGIRTRPWGLLHGEVRSDLWCREVLRKDVHHAEAVSPENSQSAARRSGGRMPAFGGNLPPGCDCSAGVFLDGGAVHFLDPFELLTCSLRGIQP